MEDLLREGYQETAEHDLALYAVHKEFEYVDSETSVSEYAE